MIEMASPEKKWGLTVSSRYLIVAAATASTKRVTSKTTWRIMLSKISIGAFGKKTVKATTQSAL